MHGGGGGGCGGGNSSSSSDSSTDSHYWLSDPMGPGMGDWPIHGFSNHSWTGGGGKKATFAGLQPDLAMGRHAVRAASGPGVCHPPPIRFQLHGTSTPTSEVAAASSVSPLRCSALRGTFPTCRSLVTLTPFPTNTSTQRSPVPSGRGCRCRRCTTS